MRVKIAGEMIYARGKQAPTLIPYLKTLTTKKRIDEGFRDWDEFARWMRQVGNTRVKAGLESHGHKEKRKRK